MTENKESKNTLTLIAKSTLPKAFREDYERFHEESDKWVFDFINASRSYDGQGLTLFGRMLKSALNFDTVAMQQIHAYGRDYCVTESGLSTLDLYIPPRSHERLSKITSKLGYYSRCATYPYPNQANKIGSLDIAANRRSLWYEELAPRQNDLGERLTMTRIISECLETAPNVPELFLAHRIDEYTKYAAEGRAPLEIAEFECLVEPAVRSALNDY